MLEHAIIMIEHLIEYRLTTRYAIRLSGMKVADHEHLTLRDLQSYDKNVLSCIKPSDGCQFSEYRCLFSEWAAIDTALEQVPAWVVMADEATVTIEFDPANEEKVRHIMEGLHGIYQSNNSI